MTRFQNVGVFVREKVWLENSLSQQAQAIFEPILFPYKYSNILKPSHSSYLRAYEDGTERVFRNVGIKHSEAGELPRRKHTMILLFLLFICLRLCFWWNIKCRRCALPLYYFPDKHIALLILFACLCE